MTNGGNTAFTGAAADHVTFAYGRNHPERPFPHGAQGADRGHYRQKRQWKIHPAAAFHALLGCRQRQNHLGGADIRSVNTAALRSQESFVTQDTELFADTIENNVRIANRNATHEQVVEACQRHRCMILLPACPRVWYPGGGTGRCAFRRRAPAHWRGPCLLHDAPFVLMDEPTSNLDSLNEGVILKAVKEECRDKTVLLVSHRASTMAVANTVYSVESGRVS